MRRLLRPLSAAALLALAACQRGKVDVGSIEMVHRVQQQALASKTALDLTRQLTEQAGPRLAGSEGYAKAVDWALAAMVGAGLANVHVEKVDHVPHWERGATSAEIVAPVRRPVALAALGGSVGTPAEGLEAEVVEATSLAGIDALGDRARGKIVFLDVKTERTRDGAGYGNAVPARSQGASRAAKVGAVAFVLRSIGTDGGPHPHTGGMRYADDAPRIPAAALAQADADALHALVAKGEPVRLRLALGCRTLPDGEAANVVGEVPGKDRADQIVLLGAHLDSWDLGRGAIDDGAGCGAVVAAAKLLREMTVPPRRTVRVVLFANEENGLAGARAYAKAHEKELGRHVLALEADLGSAAPYAIGFKTGPEPLFARKAAAIAHTVAPLGIEPMIGEPHEGADLIPLVAAGVPFAELQQDASRYFDVHHTAADTMDAVDPDGLAHLVAGVMSVAFGAAEVDGDFGRLAEDRRARQ